MNRHGKQPEGLARLRRNHTQCFGDHHGAHGIGRYHTAHHGVSEILQQQAGVKQKLEGQDHQQHGSNGSAQQLHPAIEVTGILPTPTKAGDAERQTRHGGWGGSQ